MPLTPKQMSEIGNKSKAFKKLYLSDLPDILEHPRKLTDDEVALIKSRIGLVAQVIKSDYDRGLDQDASILSHLLGDLRSMLLVDKRFREIDPKGELERWNNLSEAEKNYESMIINHPEWRVQSNPLLDMTGSIMEESQSTDVAVFQAAVVGGILACAMPPKVVGPPRSAATSGPIISRIVAFTGTRAQFRDWVLTKLQSEPNNPLRFLLNANRTGFKQVSSRAHSELIDNPDVWEAGHISSDKLGGNRLMIQSAWENQVQNISVEHPRVGGGVLDNPAIEVGGLPVAKSTVTWWENAGLLPAGTAARAPVIQ